LSAAEQYDRVWRETYGDMQDRGPVHRHMRRLLANLLGDLDYEDALEVGCGAGHNFDLLGGPITGADVSPEALRLARERGAGEIIELDIESARLERSWDLVFSSLVLEHLQDDVAALANMRAMTRRHLVVTTIAGDWERYRPWEEQVGHLRNYRRGELEERLRSVGFEVRRAIYWGFPFYSPITRLAQNRWRAEPSFSPAARAIARLLYGVYALNSSRRGDLLVVHATPRIDALSS
jgi:SAM-dependent methyltransferase